VKAAFEGRADIADLLLKSNAKVDDFLGVLRQNPSAVPWEAEHNRVNTLTQPWSSSLISACSILALNAAICRRISAFSRSKDSRDLNSDRIKCQLK